MSVLKIGDKAPQFELLNQDGLSVALRDFRGKRVILYFYPKDHTPGCTIEACDFSLNYDKFRDKNIVIIGISPDSVNSHESFIKQFNLKHILLSDSQKEVARAYGVWGMKRSYGREYEGIIRSTFLIDEEGNIAQIYSNVNAKNHVAKILESL